MKKFISVLLVIVMFGSFSAFAATQTYPVSLSVEAVVGEKPIVSSQDALELDVPAETLTFVEDNGSMLIYSDNNSNTYILSPYATQDISENIYNNYNDFQIFVMVDSVQ